MSRTESVLGVILCGGMSSRMGKDKGLILNKEKLWAAQAKELLESLGLPTIVSVRREQLGQYAGTLPNCQLLPDSQEIEVPGPLRGLLSVHLSYPEKHLMVLACDMPFMKAAAISRLLEEYPKCQGEALAYRKASGVEPLCGIYGAKGLQKILEWSRKGTLKRFSMHHVLDLLGAAYLEPESSWNTFFLNINTPADIENYANGPH